VKRLIKKGKITMVEFKYTELLPLGEDSTEYRKISDTGFKIEKLGDKEFLVIDPEAPNTY
jgi:fumarate hydratase class I